jgi:hypothetical protein
LIQKKQDFLCCPTASLLEGYLHPPASLLHRTRSCAAVEAGNKPPPFFRSKAYFPALPGVLPPGGLLEDDERPAATLRTNTKKHIWLVYLTWTTLFVSAGRQMGDRGSNRGKCSLSARGPQAPD